MFPPTSVPASMGFPSVAFLLPRTHVEVSISREVPSVFFFFALSMAAEGVRSTALVSLLGYPCCLRNSRTTVKTCMFELFAAAAKIPEIRRNSAVEID